jgi:hypothetical protein
MTATEINREIVSLTPEERTKVRAFLTQLERSSDSGYFESIDRKIARMQVGQAVTAEELRQLNTILEKAGE